MDVPDVLTINGVTIDLGNELLLDPSGKPIVLRRQCFAVLRHLIGDAGRLVTKDQLMAAVWPGIVVTDDSLVQCIHEIRRALGDDGHAVLKTVPKRGYRFVLVPGAAMVNSAVTATAPSKLRRPGHAASIILAIAALVFLAQVSWRDAAIPSPDNDRDGANPEIAVLPFHNTSSDPRQGYFSDGITEDLITGLASVPDVYVIARNSAFAYKDRPVSADIVARELGVRYILDGSVRRDGDHVRINAKLIDAENDHLIWADRYEGALADISSLQDQVVANILSALAAKLPSRSVKVHALGETNNPQAYDALLLGLERLHLDTEDDTLKAIAHFERATQLDPDFGRAYAALAAAQLRLILSDSHLMAMGELDRAYNSMRVSLAKAMKQPTSLAYTVAAEWALHTGNATEPTSLIEKAKALAPNDASVLLKEAAIFNAIGRAAEAEADLRLAMRLDPNFAPATLRALSVSLFEQDKYWEAIEIVGRIKAQGTAAMDDYLTLIASLGHLGTTTGVSDSIEAYNAMARQAGKEAISVQEAQWRWHGDLFNYHRPYVEKLVAGLRKAGVAEGAGTDVSFGSYQALIHRRDDGGFTVDGVHDLHALSAGTLFDHGVKFVDVRAHGSYAQGHVPGAVNLPLVFALSKDTLLRVARPQDQIVFYCDSKYCEYSAIAAAKAVLWGYTRVYRIQGGVPAWKDADCPMEMASQK